MQKQINPEYISIYFWQIIFLDQKQNCMNRKNTDHAGNLQTKNFRRENFI